MRKYTFTHAVNRSNSHETDDEKDPKWATIKIKSGRTKRNEHKRREKCESARKMDSINGSVNVRFVVETLTQTHSTIMICRHLLRPLMHERDTCRIRPFAARSSKCGIIRSTVLFWQSLPVQHSTHCRKRNIYANFAPTKIWKSIERVTTFSSKRICKLCCKTSAVCWSVEATIKWVNLSGNIIYARQMYPTEKCVRAWERQPCGIL